MCMLESYCFNVAMRQASERTSSLLVLFSNRSNWFSYIKNFPKFIVCRFFNTSHQILIDEKVSAIKLSLNTNVSQHLVPFMVTVAMRIMLVIMDVLVKAVLTISVEDTTLTLLVVGYKAVLDELSGTVGMTACRRKMLRSYGTCGRPAK